MEDMWLHYFTNDESFPFFIQYGAHEDTMFMHGHADFSELTIVLDGSADHVVENEHFPVQKGDVFVMGKDEMAAALCSMAVVALKTVFHWPNYLTMICEAGMLEAFAVAWIIKSGVFPQI